MRVETTGNQELTVTGNIKSVDDYLAIRNLMNDMVAQGAKELLVRIPDSFSMPSSAIGYFMQLINGNKVKLRLLVGDKNLYELLDEMNLLQILSVSKGKGHLG